MNSAVCTHPSFRFGIEAGSRGLGRGWGPSDSKGKVSSHKSLSSGSKLSRCNQERCLWMQLGRSSRRFRSNPRVFQRSGRRFNPIRSSLSPFGWLRGQDGKYFHLIPCTFVELFHEHSNPLVEKKVQERIVTYLPTCEINQFLSAV